METTQPSGGQFSAAVDTRTWTSAVPGRSPRWRRGDRGDRQLRPRDPQSDVGDSALEVCWRALLRSQQAHGLRGCGWSSPTSTPVSSPRCAGCSQGLDTLCRAISWAIKHRESRSLAVPTGQARQSGDALGRTVTATFQAGHARSILVTRSAAFTMVRLESRRPVVIEHGALVPLRAQTFPEVMTGPVRLERPKPPRWPDPASWCDADRSTRPACSRVRDTHQLASTGAPGRGEVVPGVPEIMEMQIRRNDIANLLLRPPPDPRKAPPGRRYPYPPANIRPSGPTSANRSR
jgi:hypothetical protein